ncbi:hypothetical protein PENPOL_c004G01929 [Penicillium polonicum]|uniref:Uncharacterized protein n=1 Tax=Penicillium polonicum TaxID=60169 RepID=A0A1V6NPY5_PENPO|nr:hypothetical protein PENPOL_c004G01929 [Penicillium polonicum]
MESIPTFPHGAVVARSLRGIEAQFTLAMGDAYDYKIGRDDFDLKICIHDMVSHSVTNFLGFSQIDSVARYFAINKPTKTSFRRKLARAVDTLYLRRFFIGKSHVDHRDPILRCVGLSQK